MDSESPETVGSPGDASKRTVGATVVMFFSRRPHAVPVVIAAAMLVGALGRWPYDYYRLLRVVTCAVAVLVACLAYSWKQFWTTWLFGVVAVLFNPLLPVHLKRQTWQYIDPVVAGVFLVGMFLLAKPRPCERPDR